MLWIAVACTCWLGAPEADVLRIGMETWDAVIEQRDIDVVWVLLAGSDNAPATSVFVSVLERACLHADGLVRFGLIMNDEALNARLGVPSLPALILVHRDGRQVYQGKLHYKALVAAAARLICDRSEPADDSWLVDGSGGVVLVTERTKCPALWAGVSCSFAGRVRVGVAAAAEAGTFGIRRVPGIVFIGADGSRTVYRGRTTFGQLARAVEGWLTGTYEEPLALDSVWGLPREMASCGDFAGYLVLFASDTLSQDERDLADQYGDVAQFFYGIAELPAFAEEWGVYIAMPSQGRVWRVNDVDDVGAVLSGQGQLIAGNAARWEML